MDMRIPLKNMSSNLCHLWTLPPVAETKCWFPSHRTLLGFNGSGTLFRSVPHQSQLPHPDVYVSINISHLLPLRNSPGLLYSSVDDLSMMFTTTPVLHRVMTASASPGVTLIVGIVLGSTLLALVIYHLKTDELLLHSLFFVGSVTVIGVFTMRLINARTRAGSEARRQIWGMVRFGAGNILISRHADSETPAKILRRYIQFGILALDG